jgi:hypothetical protein
MLLEAIFKFMDRDTSMQAVSVENNAKGRIPLYKFIPFIYNLKK